VANYFHTLYQRGQDGAQADWASWRMPTSANPHIPAAEIEAAREDLSEAAFSQEYEAAFVSWEGAVFRRIPDAIKDPPANVPAVAIGVDWGRSNDYRSLRDCPPAGKCSLSIVFAVWSTLFNGRAYRLSGNALDGGLGSSRNRTRWAAR
jgi:hypothetical protein